MGKKIYKYFSPEVLSLVFSTPDICSIKCSFPKDYNDPFELFLGVDPACGAELLAIYREIVFELPQHPTTCFSNSPVVTPMWAHYAQNHKGFAIEFDADALKSTFSESALGDVTYRDKPDARIEDALLRAAVAKKPRHAIWLRQSVMSAAYFSKHSCWAYEEECRFVASSSDVIEIGGSMLLNVPLDAVTALIVGKNSSKDLRDQTKALADSSGVLWYEELIGRSHPHPYFKSASGHTSVFGPNGIHEISETCEGCSEPVGAESELCPWCAITELHEDEAARGNPLRILDHYGALDAYLAEVANIERSRKR